MKRSQHRMPMRLGRQAYPSDLTDEQWALLEPLVPAIAPDAAYHVHERREIVKAISTCCEAAAPGACYPTSFLRGKPCIPPSVDGNTKGSGIRSCGPYVCGCAKSKAETTSRVQPSSRVNPSKPAPFEVPRRASIWEKNLGSQASRLGRYARQPLGHQSDRS